MNIIKKLRDWWYKNVVWRRYNIGKRFHCGRGVFLWARDEITIGDDFYIGKYSIIETNCRIGNGVILAPQLPTGRNSCETGQLHT